MHCVYFQKFTNSREFEILISHVVVVVANCTAKLSAFIISHYHIKYVQIMEVVKKCAITHLLYYF